MTTRIKELPSAAGDIERQLNGASFAVKILDLLRLPLFAFGVPPSCLATLRFATIHVRPCALSPFSSKRSKLLLSLRRFSAL